MDENTKFLAAKIAALEVLVEKLLIEEFARAGDPVAAAIAFADAIQETEARHRGTTVPQDIALEMSDSLINIIDRVTARLQRRAHPE